MKILVRGTNWIGDAVMTVPALRELRRIFPDASIALHTRSWADGLFRDADFIDELVTFEKDRWKIREIYKNTEFLKADGYDLAVLMPNSFESALTSFLSGIPRRIGYNKDVRGLLLTDPVAVPEWKSRRHEVYYYLNLVAEVEKRVLGRETVGGLDPDPILAISEDRQIAAKAFLAKQGVDLSKKTVALGAGSTNSRAKQWPADRFAALADRLSEEGDVNVVLIGSEGDGDVAAAVVAGTKGKPLDITGKTDIGEAAALLSVVDLLISNDMGLAHVAPAVGTETIAIFGPTNPETTRPFSFKSEVIRHQVECSPCMLRDCPIDHRCMTRISVDEVMAAAMIKLLPVEDDLLYEETGSIS